MYAKARQKLTNINGNIPVGCLDSVLNEPSLKRYSVNCLLQTKLQRQPYKNPFCLFRALTVCLHELFTEFILISGYDPKSFRKVALDAQLLAKKIVGRNLFINDFDIQEGKYVVELAQ